ncbi:MAG: FAD-dependent oxidoreductase [Oscillospiraceae bacterium]|nr:FAD-dependent oxidoreductase [Oscillospiraceae bacterium]
MYDIIIIGSGPAGLTAAIYAKRAQFSVLVAEKDHMGTGQIAVTERVDNYPGLYGISGFDLGESFRKHAEELGAEFFNGEVTKIERDRKNWRVDFADGSAQTAKAIIYSAGTSYRRLGVNGDGKQRVSYCAVCDGAFYKDKTVAVIGGGDTALGDALYLSKLAKTVYLVHRRDEFRANKSLQKQVSGTANIVTIMSAVLTEVTGGTNAEGITYARNGETFSLAVDGVFAAVGSVPNSQLLNGICELDGSGYVAAGEDCRTSAEGLFAAGDVRTTTLRQVITAAADGANAAISAERYIDRSE